MMECKEQTYLEEDAGIEGERLGWVGHLLAGAGSDSGGLTLPPQPQVAVHHSCTRTVKGTLKQEFQNLSDGARKR